MSKRNPFRPFAGLQRVNLEGVQFRLVDAQHQVVGRLCTQLATILQGKDKPYYDPCKDYGDICVVVNASKVEFSGKKWDEKKYMWHTGYPGGIREIKAKQLWEKDCTEILFKAVKGMLPRNNIRNDRLRKLRIFPHAEHSFASVDLRPFEMPPRRLRDRSLGWQIPAGFEPMNAVGYGTRMRTSRLPQRGRGPAVTFDDLLSPEERALVVSSRVTGDGSAQTQGE